MKLVKGVLLQVFELRVYG